MLTAGVGVRIVGGARTTQGTEDSSEESISDARRPSLRELVVSSQVLLNEACMASMGLVEGVDQDDTQRMEHNERLQERLTVTGKDTEKIYGKLVAWEEFAAKWKNSPNFYIVDVAETRYALDDPIDNSVIPTDGNEDNERKQDDRPANFLGLLQILRWTSIGRIQNEKILKKLQNSIGRSRSSTDTTLGSTDTTQTSIDITHSSVEGSFSLGDLPKPWLDLSVQPELYQYLENFYRNKSK
ncbi:hypothetical protein Gotri_018873 [Gossypium trilobum]|uniref:Uncharacterized protein n=1 Tax=Gossypium trilobum TaxID=34281 RepID=A0A7J9EBE2_9ROSI|nr:hypothetical protein [Gossypium trilobum]